MGNKNIVDQEQIDIENIQDKNRNLENKEHIEVEILETKDNDKPIEKKMTTIQIILSYKPVLYFFMFIVIFGAIVISKDYIFSMINKNEHSKVVHDDNSSTKIEKNWDDEKNVQLDKDKLTNKISEILKKIENKRLEQNKLFEDEINKILDKEFASSYNNIPMFADWFYSYTTQYKILGIGAKGIVDKYRGIGSDLSLTDSATIAISDYMATHYKDLVLRPHLLEPSLKISLKNLIDKYTNDKNLFFKSLDNEFKEYISINNIDLAKIGYKDMYLNWEANIANSRNLITYKDKEAEGGGTIIGGAVALSGMASSKIASATAGKALATKVVAKVGIKKLVAMGLPKLISLAAGAVTFGVGTGIGLGADYLINEGDEALYRKSFEEDTQKELDNMKNNIVTILEDSKVIELMYQRDENIYKEFINKK